MFVIPNVDNPSFPGQAVPDSTDWQAVTLALDGTYVTTGLAVSSTGGRGVTVATGTFVVAGTAHTLATPVTVAVTAASTGDRRDIVVISTAGSVSVVEGSPCTTTGWAATSIGLPPVKPTIPATSLILAEVYVPGTSTTITSANLVDKRVVEIVSSGIPLSQKGANTGVASLTSSGHITTAEMAALTGNVTKAAGTATTVVVAVPHTAVVGTTGVTAGSTTGGKVKLKATIHSGTLSAVSHVYTPTFGAPRNVFHIATPTANLTIANWTGTPQDGAVLILEIAGGSHTPACTITWTTSYKSSGVATLPLVCVKTKTITCGFIYNATAAKCVLLSLDAVGY